MIVYQGEIMSLCGELRKGNINWYQYFPVLSYKTFFFLKLQLLFKIKGKVNERIPRLVSKQTLGKD
jgi:hypothetical protein